jgi:TusA-related sulfurtransferase
MSTPAPETIPDRILDARDMEPPEPMDRTLEALEELLPGQRLRLLLPREPYPLYGILNRNGYRHQAEPQPDGHFVILIWR